MHCSGFGSNSEIKGNQMYLKRTGRMVMAVGLNKVGKRIKLAPQLDFISISAASGDLRATCELTVLPTGLNSHNLTNLVH